MVNENTEYEKFTQQVYQEILRQEGNLNIVVQHDVKLLGNSGCEHQIDVYWEFKIAGTTHKVAIECKNYSRPISIGEVRDFAAVIDDLIDVKGIMATTVDYQSGALQFAESKKIDLKILRKPIAEDWDGCIKTIVTQFHFIQPTNFRLSGEFDREWFIREKGLKIGDKFEMHIDTEKTVIENIAENTNKSLREIISSIPKPSGEARNLIYKMEFSNAYLVTNTERAKINTLIITYDIISIHQELIIDAQELILAILKDANNGDEQFIKK